MKKFTILFIVFLSLFSCKEKSSNTNSETKTNEASKDKIPSKTYSEISIAQGGEWVDGPKGHKEYTARTSFKNIDSLQVPKEHTDHSWYIRYEGPGWENSQIGYRLYLDWRNAIDIYGKKVDSLVLPFVGQDGFDSYHEPSAWGQDILKAGKSMGIGGYGRLVNDTIAHFQSVKNTFASVKNLNNYSTVNISYENWKTGNDSINLYSQLTIYPEDRFTKAELTPSKEISGICTGIVKFKDIPLIKNEGSNWAYIATYGTQTLVSETDKLGMAIFYKLDEVTEQKDGIDDHLVIFKPSTNPITYYFLGAWEQEPNGIKTEKSFISDLNTKLERLEKTNSIN
jgi:hypothetical protein